MGLAGLDIRVLCPLVIIMTIAMPTRTSLSVSFKPELVDYIGNRVASGEYQSASEVVRARLRLLQRDEAAAARPAELMLRCQRQEGHEPDDG